MLLTYGNIRKSAYLKYIFGDVEEGEQQFPSGGHYKLFEDLHDASVNIKTENEDVVLELCTASNTNKRIVFRKAKIISKNRVKRSGHIARLNKPVVPYEYGYEEIYTDSGNNYITFVLFYKRRSKKRSFSDRMLLTIRYEEVL
ncbi:MAG: hypothetical protein J5554_00275 [Paludibacteraceae bacterium]|nr:hypothetical protein [Paludibacteraceae bacterium]